MHKEDTQVLVRPLAPLDFGGSPVHFIEYMGKPVIPAREVAERLGYADPTDLANGIADQWRADFVEGTDFVRLVGADLEAVKAIDNTVGDGVVGPRAKQVLLLTESGAQLAAMLSRTDRGREFRRWVVDVAIPALREHAAQQGKAHLLAAVGTSRDRTALVWAATGQERVALWRAAESLHKAETQAQRAALDVEQKRKTRELMEHRRFIAEMNQAERRRLVGRLLVEMQHEIEDRRAKVKSPRTVERLAEKVATAALDERCGQGLAPNLLREVMAQ